MSTTNSRPTKREEVTEEYRHRQARFEAERVGLNRRAWWISMTRLVVFLAALGCLVRGFWGLRVDSPELVASGFFGLIAFVALVIWHDRVLRRHDSAEVLVAINREALSRMERRWEELPKLTVSEPAAADPVARDLDLFPTDRSRASLLQLLGPQATAQGRTVAERWLLEGSSPEEIPRRQRAVDELAGRLDFRQELELLGRQLGPKPPDPEQFLEWAEGEPWLMKKPALLWLTRALAVIGVTLTTLRIMGLVPTGYVVLALSINLLISFAYSRRIMDIYDTISGREHAARHYAGLFRLLDRQRYDSEVLGDLSKVLAPGGRRASEHMQQLERLGGLADARFTPLFHIPLVALTLWDFHVIWGFERWRAQIGGAVRGWFEALGEIEALSALSTVRHDHPDWVFPEVIDGAEPVLRARGLGHPLLPPSSCVTNDVEVGPPGSFLLVTGSNMSGKSTLLRSIGVNVVLAQAGAPVCAAELTLPPLVLGTSFRVHDSLEAGVSFFMAELRRLKEVVDIARRQREGDEGRLLYLLDEILQGTNVYERQIAVRRVLLKLLNDEAIGAISTHDLTLAEAEELADACIPCHFTETYERDESGPHMHFDYRLREGVASTVNALKLLEIVGLEE